MRPVYRKPQVTVLGDAEVLTGGGIRGAAQEVMYSTTSAVLDL